MNQVELDDDILRGSAKTGLEESQFQVAMKSRQMLGGKALLPALPFEARLTFGLI